MQAINAVDTHITDINKTKRSMIKFVEVNVHYYMDMHPFKEVHILDTETMHEWARKSQQNWGSGTVSISRVLGPQEAYDYCINTFSKILTDQPINE